MLSSYGKDPYALKQCLSGEALTVVKGVDNDFEEMFRRLDMKYGRAEKLIDHILNELKRLKKVQEGDNMKFISLVETVEKCWLDLKTHEPRSRDEHSNYGESDRKTPIAYTKTCLKIGHLSRHCHSRKPCDIQNELHQTCGKIHHKNLHTAHIDGISFHNSTQVINDDKNKNGVLLMISSVQCKDMSLTTLWDPGANMSLITHKTAKRLGLSGQDITLSVTKVGNVTEHVQSKEYVIPLTDLRGKIWTIKAYGMEEVTAEVARVDMSRVDQLFKGINKNDIQRPTGQVDILIGTDCCILMPNKEEQIGNLQLMRNQFGYCIRGSHPLLEVPKLSNHGIVRIYWASGKIIPLNDIHVLDRDSIKDKLDSLFDIEGPQITLKCGSCKCGKCAIGQSQHSIREERN
ncbi:unnamed protein product [Mytilus coruscus]|uniref:Uncharacterized protein n=1 Tax=Mytilus coruscus TaxID=42192 RepID=A0A6J8A881_MYTCO|nr:unnamed protein product [Mytilus coruscus]